MPPLRCATPLCLAVFRRVLRARDLLPRRLYARFSGARRVRGSTRLARSSNNSQSPRRVGRTCLLAPGRRDQRTAPNRFPPASHAGNGGCVRCSVLARSSTAARKAALSTPASAQAAFLPRQTAHRRTPTVVMRRRLRAAPRGLSVRLAGMPAAALWRNQALRLAHGHAPASTARGCTFWRDRRWEHGACGNILDGGRKRKAQHVPTALPLSTGRMQTTTMQTTGPALAPLQ
jgi:hypothetical protein